MRTRGLLVALCGVDCAGKSTQRDRLLEALAAQGITPITVYTRPGYTPGLRVVKRTVRALSGRKERARSDAAGAPNRFPRRAANLGHPLVRWLWLRAALLDLLLLYALRVRLWRARGRTVLCNRYLLDALVDFRVNFPGQRVERGWLGRSLRRAAPRPDAAFALIVPPEETLARARAKSRRHWETLEVLRARWREYRVLCDDLAVQVLDGTRPPEELARVIRERVEEVRPAPAELCGRAARAQE